MISAEFKYNSQHKICGFCIRGHAGYANNGHDIICSAVSILAINTINSIEKLTNDKFKCNKVEKDGLLELKVTALSDSSELLLKSMRLGVIGIADEYGSRYVKIVN